MMGMLTLVANWQQKFRIFKKYKVIILLMVINAVNQKKMQKENKITNLS
jgi:hypothetical protein